MKWSDPHNESTPGESWRLVGRTPPDRTHTTYVEVDLRGADGKTMTRRVKGRWVVTVGGRTFVAVDAHDLLDATSEMGRPGMPY